MNEAPTRNAQGRVSQSAESRLSGSRRGVDRLAFDSRLGGLREAKAQRTELRELLLRQLVIPILEIRHRLVEPIFLVLWSRLRHSATNHLLKHLISCLLERRWYAHFLAAISAVIGHASCWVWKSCKCKGFRIVFPLNGRSAPVVANGRSIIAQPASRF